MQQRREKMDDLTSRYGRLGAYLMVACLCIAIGSEVRGEPTTEQQPYSGPPVHLKIVGGLDGVHQYTRHEVPFWTKLLAARTGGKVTAEIVPFDKAGIRGTEVLRLMQVGTVPFGTALLGVSASTDPEYGAADLAGLNADIGAMKRIVAKVRPIMARSLRKLYGIELLAIYAYPAQVLYCKEPITGLNSLAGRRVRTATPSQSDFVEALGGTAVRTSFTEIMDNMVAGNTDCAITGSMSGNTIGLDRRTTHLFDMPISWGLSMFGANAATWKTLPPDLQTLLSTELVKLEAEVWDEAARESDEGLACNTGARGCVSGRLGNMILVKASPRDMAFRRAAFESTVLPRWLARCGDVCTEIWRNTLRPLYEKGNGP
jgi:TRAP-type C4-dicarboxylate transport system substrate-binding protein